jgi:hypothetical protein
VALELVLYDSPPSVSPGHRYLPLAMTHIHPLDAEVGEVIVATRHY